MAVTTLSDFKIYNDQVQSAIAERMAVNLGIFNGAANNTIRLLTQAKGGQIDKTAFFEQLSDDADARRDPSSTANVDDVSFQQGEIIEIKVDRRIGPIAWTLDGLRKSGVTPETASFYLGQQIADLKSKTMLNSAILAMGAALGGQISTNGLDKTSASSAADRKLKTAYLIQAMSLFGDSAERIRAWVTHSTPRFNVMQEQAGIPTTNVLDRVIYGATIGTVDRPMIPTDISAMRIPADATGEIDKYLTFGLVQDAVRVTETEQAEVVSEIVTGKDNLMMRLQSEYAFNLGVRGFSWKTGTGGVNPNAAALGTPGNWEKVMQDPKDLAGVFILTAA